MTMSFGPNLGLLVDGAIGEQHFANLMAQFRGIDGLVQCHVKDKDLATPPASPVNGDMYIVAASPTGAWVGHAGKLAYYYVIPANGSNGASGTTGWQFFTPRKGWRTHVEDENADYQYNGSTWAVASGGGGGSFTGGTLTSALNEAPPASLASAATVAIGAAAANTVNITGTTTITAFDTIAAGAIRRVIFGGALTLTHNATSLILPTGANITTAAGDIAEFISLGSGNWRCVNYTRANGQALAGSSSFTGGTLTSALNMAPPVSLASAATVNIGAAAANTVNITGTTTITSFGTIAAGARRTLIFAGALTLTHNATSLILPGGVNITTAAGDVAEFESLGSGNWRCMEYTRANGLPVVSDPWENQPIGVPIPVFSHITGVSLPPTDRSYRYIKLTASDSYNTGVLTSESVSGSAPLVLATAVISLAGSPINGQTVQLINTERRALRAGSSGTLQNDAMQGHWHDVYRSSDSGRPRFQSASGGNTVNGISNNTTGTVDINSYLGRDVITDGTNGTPRIDTETRSKNIGADYYMRIR